MDVDVTTKFTPLDFGATGIKEILQNVRMILSTAEYSCPLNRGFAWNPDVDAPINIVQAKQIHRLIEAVKKYEPRAQVVNVAFQGSEDGMLKPIVRVRIDDNTTV
jgi:phage baseplate assembly protein W